jgi:hypothetical protein
MRINEYLHSHVKTHKTIGGCLLQAGIDLDEDSDEENELAEGMI